MKGLPVKSKVYQSASEPTRMYKVLEYMDGSLSCNCPRWTRRKDRVCKHTINYAQNFQSVLPAPEPLTKDKAKEFVARKQTAAKLETTNQNKRRFNLDL